MRRQADEIANLKIRNRLMFQTTLDAYQQQLDSKEEEVSASLFFLGKHCCDCKITNKGLVEQVELSRCKFRCMND